MLLLSLLLLLVVCTGADGDWVELSSVIHHAEKKVLKHQGEDEMSNMKYVNILSACYHQTKNKRLYTGFLSKF